MGLEEVEVVLKRFGDEQSSLLDRFERLSFEVHLNQAILGRSLSAPPPPLRSSCSSRPPSDQCNAASRAGRVLAFHKLFKKLLLKPIFGTRKSKHSSDQKSFKFVKAFSRSLRV